MNPNDLQKLYALEAALDIAEKLAKDAGYNITANDVGVHLRELRRRIEKDKQRLGVK